jgi:glycosyltransferase involved in cell wall biosynthesis
VKAINKILFITGSYPPDVCGVGDYSKKLFDSLNIEFNIVELYHKKKWGINNLFSYLREIKLTKADIFHFQYPTEGYGFSILPLLLMLFLPKKKLIITIHELTNRTLKAKLFTVSLLFFNNSIIVTNMIELNYLKKIPFIKRKKIYVINIGSNIPASKNSTRDFMLRKFDLAYFGHIRPIKGLEGFILMSRNLGFSKKSVIIGQNLIKYESYLDGLKAISTNITYILNETASNTAEYLSDCKVLYLPFPDGVSMRRGSLMAGALNGCIIVTTKSKDLDTNIFFSQYCYLVSNEEDAKEIIDQLLSKSKTLPYKDTSKLISTFSWDEIAKKHFRVYEMNN